MIRTVSKKLFRSWQWAVMAAATVMVMALITTSFTSVQPAVYNYNHENVLGTSFQLKVLAKSESIADQAEQVALNEIDRLAGILSTYDPTSEVSRWLKTSNTPERISNELFEVLDLFDRWSTNTRGALNPSVATASTLWKTAEKQQTLPSDQDLNVAVALMKTQQWQLDHVNHTATHLTNQPLVLNSFVKSYIIDKVSRKVLELPGVTGVVTDVGGDIAVQGDAQETIRIVNPNAYAENGMPVSTLRLEDQAVATSGNYRRGYSINGTWYSHILDPHTALPVSEVVSATVVATNPTDAGALATAFNAMQPSQSQALASTFADVEYKIITHNGTIQSDGWKTLESESPSIATRANGLGTMKINLELTQFEGRFRRPFVAVWIENSKKESVRTVSLWFNKPRWLPDLKRWYSKNQDIVSDWGTMSSLSSATRSPGQYTLVWDGLDDQGKALPAGTYTVYLEAAREHGTYQLIKQEITWNGKARHISLKGGVEIASASLDISGK